MPNDEGSTKDRILDAAERLFARDGVDATSLRAITAEAGVNLAAVNYHFQSKEALIQAVFGRRLGPINRRRIGLLDELEAKHPVSVPLADLLDTFIRPVIEAGATFRPLMGRLYAEPRDLFRRVMGAEMGEIARRYRTAFQKTLPSLPPLELAWRIHFIVGGLAHTLAAPGLLEIISQGSADPSDVEAVTRRMIRFFSAGLEAPWEGQQ